MNNRDFYPAQNGAYESSYLEESKTYKITENNTEAYTPQKYIDGKYYAGPRIPEGTVLIAVGSPQTMASVGPDGTEGGPRLFVQVLINDKIYYVPNDLLTRRPNSMLFTVNNPATYPYNIKTRINKNSVASLLPLNYEMTGSKETDLIPTINKDGSKGEFYYMITTLSGNPAYVPVEKVSTITTTSNTGGGTGNNVIDPSQKTCKELAVMFGIIPGKTFGTASASVKQNWIDRKCTLTDLAERSGDDTTGTVYDEPSGGIIEKLKQNKMAAILIIAIILVLITAFIIYRRRQAKN